ncbi:MAG: hypothetical protein R3191_03160 [Anaerolineales bacterium]|nr:hypothetical protein [Anaerolineales bacterium]
MASQALFQGLVVDARDRPVDVVQVGGEAFYVVDDDGFRRHVESEHVDRQVLREFARMIEGHEETISEGTMRMLGQEDIFTKAMIERSLSDMEENFDRMLDTGLPEQARLTLGMLGFRVVIDVHGNVLQVEQPAGPAED